MLGRTRPYKRRDNTETLLQSKNFHITKYFTEFPSFLFLLVIFYISQLLRFLYLTRRSNFLNVKAEHAGPTGRRDIISTKQSSSLKLLIGK